MQHLRAGCSTFIEIAQDMDAQQAGVEESIVLPQKLFAAVNTGSFHKSMTGTRVSFTLTNKLLTAIKNDPIISGKNSSLKLKGEIGRWEEKKGKMITYENSIAFYLKTEKLSNNFYCLSMKEQNKTSYCNCFLTIDFSINSICVLITVLKPSEENLLCYMLFLYNHSQYYSLNRHAIQIKVHFYSIPFKSLKHLYNSSALT